MRNRIKYFLKRMILTMGFILAVIFGCFAQVDLGAKLNTEDIQNYINAKYAKIEIRRQEINLEKQLRYNPDNPLSNDEMKSLTERKRALSTQQSNIIVPLFPYDICYPPAFNNKIKCEEYLSTLQVMYDAVIEKRMVQQEQMGLAWNNKDSDAALNIEREMIISGIEETLLGNMKSVHYCDCDKIEYNPNAKPETNSNLEAEFLAEIAKINADIAVINRLAREKQIVESFGSAQILCDKLRRYQGQQYFSTSLKKIRKENPGFSFSITPLTEQVTREYWIRMRNRANHAYRNAMDAYRGCVWNEGLQQAAVVEIPYAFIKLTSDLVTNLQSLYSKELFGTLQKIYKGYQDPSKSLRPVMLISEDILAGGNNAYDWKTYIGIIGGVISGYDDFIKAKNMVTQYGVQGELIQANRETANQLITSGRNLLQQFDRYRAFIDSHSSSIDCLNDRIMRIDLDNKSIKGDKITIWGTGLYDWDVDEYVNMIKEAGEDLKNEYIYCEDFIKALQIAINQGNTNFMLLEEKVRNSGADQTQISAQLSHNRDNADWFEGETTRLLELYTQYCENENNTYPDDVIIVSNQVIPGVEDQDGDPNDPPVWEYEDEEVYEPINEPEYDEPEQNNNNTTGGTSATGIISKGEGWSAQKIHNNSTSIQNDINSAVNSGKTPAGIYVSNDEVVIYYIDENPLGMTSWNLEWYDGAESLQSGISNNLEQGYFPMGISFTDSGQLYVLYIMSQLSATAWQLVESEMELNSVAHDLQPFINEHYVPVGITIYSGMYYTLMAQLPDAEMTNWTIEGYENNNYIIKQNVNTKANSGLIPFGYLQEEGVVNILYVGF